MDAAPFLSFFAERLPDVASTLDPDAQSSVYMAMQALARATQRAIGDGEKETVRAHFAFVDELYCQGDDEVSNAVGVSYLECIGFDGRKAKAIKAMAMLSPRLQQALSGLESS